MHALSDFEAPVSPTNMATRGADTTPRATRDNEP
jgi:hypothetical protein